MSRREYELSEAVNALTDQLEASIALIHRLDSNYSCYDRTLHDDIERWEYHARDSIEDAQQIIDDAPPPVDPSKACAESDTREVDYARL